MVHIISATPLVSLSTCLAGNACSPLRPMLDPIALAQVILGWTVTSNSNYGYHHSPSISRQNSIPLHPSLLSHCPGPTQAERNRVTSNIYLPTYTSQSLIPEQALDLTTHTYNVLHRLHRPSSYSGITKNRPATRYSVCLRRRAQASHPWMGSAFYVLWLGDQYHTLQ